MTPVHVGRYISMPRCERDGTDGGDGEEDGAYIA
jgi:hypothetical protein